MIIGVVGKAGHGKDTVGNYLIENFGFCKNSFAAPLKRLCMEMFGLTWDQCNDAKAKEVPDKRWQGPDGKDRTPREILQLIGTEGFRRVDPQFWVKYASKVMFDYKNDGFKGVVFTDVRFVNEAEVLKFNGGAIIRVVKLGDEGEGTAHTAHASETEMDSIVADYTISARYGELDKIYAQIEEIMKNELSR